MNERPRIQLIPGTPAPKSEIDSRIRRLQSLLSKQEMEGALILQNTDLFYLSGTSQQGQLYVPADGEPILMVRKDLERARAESAIERLLPLDSPRQVPGLIREAFGRLPKTLGLEMDVVPANLYRKLASLFPEVRLVDVSPSVLTIRAVKSDYEVECIRRAGALADEVTGAIPEMIVEGMPEVELAGRIEAAARRLGHQGIVRMRLWDSEVFYGHIMAGPGAAEPSAMAFPTGGVGTGPAVPQGASLRPLRRGEPILVDYAFALAGYMVDHTRIFSIGPLPDDLLRAQDAMIELQERLRPRVRAGEIAGRIYSEALDWVDAKGYGDAFMGTGPRRVRFVGHGLGLELDEPPFLAEGQKLRFESGMVVALEPKLVFPGRGVVGIENTHVVTEAGLEAITRSPEEVIVV